MQQFSVCNMLSNMNDSRNCSVIDLGVMTPCEKIIQTAIEENAGKKQCVC